MVVSSSAGPLVKQDQAIPVACRSLLDDVVRKGIRLEGEDMRDRIILKH